MALIEKNTGVLDERLYLEEFRRKLLASPVIVKKQQEARELINSTQELANMQPIFSSNEDYTKTAFLNWRIDRNDNIWNILNLGKGYLDAAIILAKLSLENNEDKKADILIFPILTNANHGIELYLKAITWTLNTLLHSEKKIEGSHNIQQIFRTVRSRIETYDCDLSLEEFNKDTRELEEYIDELFDKIGATPKKDKMDFSRYPINNSYDNHFYVNELGNVEIDLENFVSRFETIKEKLENMSDFLFHHELNQSR